jgi:hypothetical protein
MYSLYSSPIHGMVMFVCSFFDSFCTELWIGQAMLVDLRVNIDKEQSQQSPQPCVLMGTGEFSCC